MSINKKDNNIQSSTYKLQKVLEQLRVRHETTKNIARRLTIYINIC